jgi:sec-independent protein translocase protein TatA
MIVIFLVALVLFGPKKLPELGKTIAKAVSEFRRAQNDLKATFEREMRSLEQENEALKEVTRQASIDIGNFSDFDLTGGAGGNYGAETHPVNAATDWHGVESGAPTTVGASEVPGAESHGSIGPESMGQTAVAEAPHPAVHAAEETVARGTVPPAETAAPAAVAEAPEVALMLHESPLHETQHT